MQKHKTNLKKNVKVRSCFIIRNFKMSERSAIRGILLRNASRIYTRCVCYLMETAYPRQHEHDIVLEIIFVVNFGDTETSYDFCC